MNKLLFAPVAALLMAGCASSYNVSGSSSVTALDGSKLYLKALKSGQVKNIDSCDVVHGEFHFAGLLDSVRMASLFMDDESIMPIVLEKGEISIRIDNASQTVFGTPLNDRLYEFIDFHNQLGNQMAELSHKQSRMLLDGIDETDINRQLNIEAAEIARKEDSLVTNFIVENFDNVLGPGVFMMITSMYRYPVLTPQIEDIMSKATSKFKNDPYVKDYYQVATENQARSTGMHDVNPATMPDTATMPADDSVLPADTSLQVPPLQVPLTNVPQTKQDDENAD